jgi:WD40 repeat protein
VILIWFETQVLLGHTDSVTDVRACVELGRLFSASDDGTVREWTPGNSDADHKETDKKTVQEIELNRTRSLMK